MTCEIARNICIVQALAKSGHFPKRESEKEAWFLSPFRSETQASFKVDKTLNRWYDHGMGIGGNIIDLVCQLYSCTVKEALEILNKKKLSFSFHQQPYLNKKKNLISIGEVKDISHPALIQYLQGRNIPLQIAQQYCKEAWYTLKGKTYFSIGLKNQSGGWELRNKYFKNSSSPKDISLIQNRDKLENKSNRLIITEGMFDLLSICTHDSKHRLENNTNILVLNSTAFIGKAIEIMKSYDHIELYLDHDDTGIRVSQQLLERSKNCTNKSYLYKNHKDINEWFMSKKQISI